jgi:hypothetical protein
MILAIQRADKPAVETRDVGRGERIRTSGLYVPNNERRISRTEGMQVSAGFLEKYYTKSLFQ